MASTTMHHAKFIALNSVGIPYTVQQFPDARAKQYTLALWLGKDASVKGYDGECIRDVVMSV